MAKIFTYVLPLLGIAMMLTACGQKKTSLVTPGKPSNVLTQTETDATDPDAIPMPTMLGKKERAEAWDGLSKPHETFEAYVKALRRSEYLKATAYIYMQNREVAEGTTAELMPPFAEQIREEDWEIKIVSAAKEGRFAAIIFTTTSEQDDPNPLLMIQEDNHWYMHHFQHSGRLANLLDDEREFAQARQLVAWGKSKVQELQNEIDAKKERAKKREAR